MWGSFVLLLVFTIFPLSSWSAAALPMLTAPSSLRTGNASHKAVLLEWDFRESEDLKISDVLFLVSLEAEPPHERRLHRLRYKTTELSFSFEDLLPGKVYIASVVATNPKWLDSPPSQISFTTMEKDWSTPEINSVIKTPRRDIAQYSVTWSELPSPGLTHVVVEVCDSNCTSYTPETTAVSTLVTVKFDSRFLIRICAFYNADVVGPIERCSRYFQGISARAPLERLLSMKNVRKVGTKVQLDWHPRLPLDGPRSYYEIYARDLNPRKSERSPIDPSKKDSIFSLALSALTDTDFELRYVTLGYERMLWHKRNPHLDITLFDLEPYQRDEPLQLKVIRMTRRRVHSLILFRTEVDKSSWFDMSTPPEHLILGAENFTFSGHKPVDFLIRTCLTYNVSGLGVCGNITATRIRNCVDGPDEVASPGYQFNGTDIEIFWKASEEPRGPIDGYRLTLIATKFGRTDKVILGPNERSYLIEDETGRAEYIVYIAAFNVDIDCGNYNNTKLFGKSVFLKVVRSHWSIRDMLLLGIRVCAAIIIGELVLSWWSYWKPDQHFATAMLWLLKRSLELYIEGWQILIRLIVLRIRRYL